MKKLFVLFLTALWLSLFAISSIAYASDDGLIQYSNEIGFDPVFYLNKYPDLVAAGYSTENVEDHWLTWGIYEGRQGSSWFDAVFYLQLYLDLQQAYENDYYAAFTHWLNNGIYEGRQGSETFDPIYYLQNYPDLQQAFGNDYYLALYHWIYFGVYEGRKGSPTYTTVDRTIVPIDVPSGSEVAIDDPANFARNGLGLWDYGPGVPYTKRIDLMSVSYDASTVSQSAKLLRFFTMTDVHITDKESPAQAIYFRNEPALGGNAISVYAPLMLYTTHVLDAAVRTINKLHKDEPIDFGLTLGDVVNSAQYNELRWFIDIMDGKIINPDSGSDDDPIAGPNNDYQDEFDAKGLNSDIPWYAAIGNHDHFWIGSKTIDAKLAATYVGDNILQTGNIITDVDAMNMNTFSNGVMDGSTLYGTIIGSGVVAEMGEIPTVPADPNRRPIIIDDIIQEYSNSTSSPAGHGFNSTNVFNGSYSFEPKADLPIKVIVLDNTMDNNHDVPPGGIYGFGMLDNGRYEWLMEQLKAGQDENKLMIIAAHVPIGVAPGTPVGWLPAPGYTSEDDLISQLQDFPNLILWVSGHRHLNQIKAFPSTDSNQPENSFWQVETKSLREFPQQFRTIDIVRNNDNTLSIFATDVDPELTSGSFADISRSYAIASSQIYGLMTPPPDSGPSIDNAELIVPLSPEMQEIIKDLGTPVNN